MIKQNEKTVSMNASNLAVAEQSLPDSVYLPLDLPCLPLSTMAHVDAFEKLLSNEMYFKQVVLFLGAIGGADAFVTTRRVMVKLMTNSLATCFNWAGRPPKRAFKLLRCRDLVINAVRCNPNLHQPVLESDIEHHVKKWLRYASGRQQ